MVLFNFFYTFYESYFFPGQTPVPPRSWLWILDLSHDPFWAIWLAEVTKSHQHHDRMETQTNVSESSILKWCSIPLNALGLNQINMCMIAVWLHQLMSVQRNLLSWISLFNDVIIHLIPFRCFMVIFFCIMPHSHFDTITCWRRTSRFEGATLTNSPISIECKL